MKPIKPIPTVRRTHILGQLLGQLEVAIEMVRTGRTDDACEVLCRVHGAVDYLLDATKLESEASDEHRIA